jgi:hypothetical protein
MRKLFRFFGKLIASVLVLVFIVSTFASVFLLAFNTSLFDPDFYLGAFEEVEFFDKLPSIAATQIKYTMGFNPCEEDPTKCEGDGPEEGEEESGQGGPPSYFQALSENDWELLLEGILPPEWLEEQVQAVTGNLFDSIEEGKGTPEIKLSLKSLKERLGGEEGVAAIVHLLDAQPECSRDDLLNMTRTLQGDQEGEGDFLSCQPPADFIEDYTPQIVVLLRRSLSDVPDEIDLGSSIFKGDGTSGSATIKVFGSEIPTLAFVKWIRWVISMTPLACLLLLIIIAFFGVYSFKALSGWWGYPLAITGSMTLAISLGVGPLVDFFSDRLLSQMDIMGLSPNLIETGSSLAIEVIQSLFSQVRDISLIVIGMGLAVIITSVVLKTPPKAEPSDGYGGPADIPGIPNPDQTDH